jgi:hypothetical protein
MFSPSSNTEKGEFIMEKKILLAVDDSIHSKNAVRYAARISSMEGRAKDVL